MGSSLGPNPPNAGRNITAGGSDWLWAVFAIMTLSDLGMVFWSFTRQRGTRLFHQIAIIVLTTASIAYFSMASDLGATPIREEFQRGGHSITRQIWYVRYIQWFITLPLLLLELLLATGVTLSDMATTVFMAWVVVVCGLVGALVPSTYKWGYFVLGCCALFYIWYILLGHGPRSTFAAGGVVRTGYLRSAGYLSFLLMLYPICWGCSEGGNVISPTGEMIWYGILDLLAGPVFFFFFLWGLNSVEFGAFGLGSGNRNGGAYGNTGSGMTGVGGNAGPGMTGIGGNAGPGMTGIGGNAGSGMTGIGGNAGSGMTGTGGRVGADRV